MAQLKKCCCFSLKTGGIIVGWFGLVGSIIALVLNISSLIFIDGTIKSMLINHSAEINQNDGEQYLVMYMCLRQILSVGIGGAIISILMNSSLLYGILKNKHLHLVPWLAMDLLVLVIFGLALLVMTIFILTVQNLVLLGLFVFLFGGSILGLKIYIWMCILSLRRQLKENECRPGDEMNIVQSLQDSLANQSPPPYKPLMA